MATSVVVVEESVRAEIKAELEKQYSDKYVEDIKKFRDELTIQNKTAMEQVIADYRKNMEPPKPEDIQKLLEQDYLTFTVKLPVGSETRSFTIRELPQAIEKKFYTRLKKPLLDLSSESEGMKLNLDGADTFKKVLSVMNAFEPLLDVMAFGAALALNPFNEEKDIDERWVREHLSSQRILQVVNAQVMCNRMRDFFSLLSKGLRLAA